MGEFNTHSLHCTGRVTGSKSKHAGGKNLMHFVHAPTCLPASFGNIIILPCHYVMSGKDRPLHRPGPHFKSQVTDIRVE